MESREHTLGLSSQAVKMLLRVVRWPVAAKPSQLRPGCKPFLDSRWLFLLGNAAVGKGLGEGVPEIATITQCAHCDIGLAFQPLIVNRVVEAVNCEVSGLWLNWRDSPR